MGNFKEHGIMLFLDKTLYIAFIRLQADKNLGRSYAGLLLLIEGLYHMGYLSRGDYEKHFRKYSQGLVEKPKPLTKGQLAEQKEIENWERRFSDVEKDWHKISEKSRKWHVKKARELVDRVSSAKDILAKIDEDH